MSENIEENVQELARQYSAQSEHHGSPFSAKGNRLDPRSEKFRAKDWAKAFYNLRYDNDTSLARVAGVSFKNLNVSGQGSPTDFQSTVGNVSLKLPSFLGRGSQKIGILHEFEGLVLSGEQLCVLGPPGYVLSLSSNSNPMLIENPVLAARRFSKPSLERRMDSRSALNHS